MIGKAFGLALMCLEVRSFEESIFLITAFDLLSLNSFDDALKIPCDKAKEKMTKIPVVSHFHHLFLHFADLLYNDYLKNVLNFYNIFPSIAYIQAYML